MHSLFPFLGACFPKPYRVLQLQVQQEVRHKAYLLGVCQRSCDLDSQGGRLAQPRNASVEVANNHSRKV